MLPIDRIFVIKHEGREKRVHGIIDGLLVVRESAIDYTQWYKKDDIPEHWERVAKMAEETLNLH